MPKIRDVYSAEVCPDKYLLWLTHAQGRNLYAAEVCTYTYVTDVRPR